MPHHHIQGKPEPFPYPVRQTGKRGAAPRRGAIILLNNFKILLFCGSVRICFSFTKAALWFVRIAAAEFRLRMAGASGLPDNPGFSGFESLVGDNKAEKGGKNIL